MSTLPILPFHDVHRFPSHFHVKGRLVKLWFAWFGLNVLLFVSSSPTSLAQTFNLDPTASALIAESIDESRRVILFGNTRPEVQAKSDRGRVAEEFRIEHMLLQLRRPSERESALAQFVEDLQNPASSNYHRWITALEFGERFGPAEKDLNTIVQWLESHGFRVNIIYPSGMVIDFSGTAAQVRSTFQTEIHKFIIKGKTHIANTADPQIPAALAPIVSGIVSLHDFNPHSMHSIRKPKTDFTFPSGLGGSNFAVTPADLATIYNLNPLFSGGYSGQGQTIALIENTDVFSTADWSTFRSTLGLSSYQSSFTTVHPAPAIGRNNCNAPGVVAPNDAEAILDAEWASAAAPSAGIQLVSCADTTTTFGGLIALQNLINSPAPPAIVSISYGECETMNGAANNAAYNSVYQQAVSEGVSVFVAAGDSGAAGCDNSASKATHGIVANAFASTPYNVAVGGTDFSDTFSGTNGTYWNQTNTPTFGSALSYIPEIPWNNSCAGSLVSQYLGHSITYGPNSLCNDPFLGSLLQTTVAGGGAPSRCATGSPSTGNIVGGTCQGWTKPSWQSVLGNPGDGVRDTPDLSLFAADGLWGHFYVFCWSDVANGGAACSGSPDNWSGAGGTSFAAPILAGIHALVNQATASRQGNPNPIYYQLAASQYGSSGDNSCNSSNGNAASNSCVFYDVTLGDMDVNCTGPDCLLGGGAMGVLSTSTSSFAPAYGTTPGWDFATGLGTINATNLVNSWPGSTPALYFTLSSSPGSLTVTQGTSGASTITVTAQNGFNGSVSLSTSGLPSGVTASFSPNPTTGASTLTLTASAAAIIGTVPVTVTGVSGSLTHTTSISLTVRLIPTLPTVWTDTDIGATGVVGSASYGANTFTVSGAGAQIYGTSDAFHFVYQPLSGDGTITARVVSLLGGSNYVTAGVMMRETLNATSTNAKTADWRGFGGIYFDVRATTGGSTTEPAHVNVTMPYWVRMSRSGSLFTSYVSLDGVNWQQLGSQTISMAQNVFVGLAVNSGNNTAVATAVFDNVSLNTASAPAPTITGVSATSGSIGSLVVITGTGFGATQGGSLVMLNNAPMTVNTWSANSISATVPTGATSGSLVVSVAPTMNDSNPIAFTVSVQALPTGWWDQDVGLVGVAGNVGYSNGTFTVNGAGAQIYGTSDAFHFVYQPLSGDGTITARVVSLLGGSGFVTAGVMIRETLNASSTNAKTADWRNYGAIYFDLRTTTGGSTTEPGHVTATLPYWVKLTRSGNTFNSYASPDGANWIQVGSGTVNMAPNTYIGLAVNSGNNTALSTASFDNVSVSSP
jgi:regulation of enolase protein 1 (concanavalin A-like superfamily)